jgi:hypothetical protein
LILILLAPGCNEPAKRATRDIVVWRSLGSWSGRGLVQTGPFISDTGTLRLRWEARNEARPGAGTFKVTVHSDVSGRPLVVAVDQKGPGREAAYVYEDPRAFFIVVDSADLDWTLAVDEGIPALAPAPDKR